MTGRVIVITSGKGGVGKTTTSANIGTALAKNGSSVVLIDTDIGLRNLDLLLGLENRIVYTLVDVVEERCKLKQALVKDMLEISIAKAKEIVTSRGTKVGNVDKLSEMIGVGAVKFGVLKTERNKDCVFDLEASLNFDGETSPYIQYTFAGA